MSFELFYTSVPRGLRPGTQGFCTVAASANLPPALAERLEALSAYRHAYRPSDPQASLNPVGHSHLCVRAGGRTYSVLSRVCDAGLDYSGRTSKFAHHVALEERELPDAGPAYLLSDPSFLETEWGDRPPRTINHARPVPDGDDPPAVCREWQRVTGDAGWAGVLAETAEAGRTAYLIFQAGQDPLPLIREALALLPPARRWATTFSTYYVGLPPDVPCQWRCVLEGSTEAREAARATGVLVIPLGRTPTAARGGALVEAARTGRVPERPAAAYAAPVPASGRHRRGADAEELAAAWDPNQPVELPAEPARPRRRAGREVMAAAVAPQRSGRGVLLLLLGLAAGLFLALVVVLAMELGSGGRPISAILGASEADRLRAERDDLEAHMKKVKVDLDGLKGENDQMLRERGELRARQLEASKRAGDKEKELQAAQEQIAQLQKELGPQKPKNQVVQGGPDPANPARPNEAVKPLPPPKEQLQPASGNGPSQAGRPVADRHLDLCYPGIDDEFREEDTKPFRRNVGATEKGKIALLGTDEKGKLKGLTVTSENDGERIKLGFAQTYDLAECYLEGSDFVIKWDPESFKRIKNKDVSLGLKALRDCVLRVTDQSGKATYWSLGKPLQLAAPVAELGKPIAKDHRKELSDEKNPDERLIKEWQTAHQDGRGDLADVASLRALQVPPRDLTVRDGLGIKVDGKRVRLTAEKKNQWAAKLADEGDGVTFRVERDEKGLTLDFSLDSVGKHITHRRKDAQRIPDAPTYKSITVESLQLLRELKDDKQTVFVVVAEIGRPAAAAAIAPQVRPAAPALHAPVQSTKPISD
jgi:hypothetical protein